MATARHTEDPTNLHRLQTGELEIGVTDALQRHITRTIHPGRPVSQRKLDFEHSRPRWLREMGAEALGVFFYVYPGIASTASYFLNDANPAFGSIFQIGWAYAIGIAFAITICASTSGGHFNPAVTIALAVWQGFPLKKVPYYIFAQVFGAFMAGLILMGQYHQQIAGFKEIAAAAKIPFNSAQGPGGILCTFPLPTQSYGYIFLIEFFVDAFIGLVIWTCLDPAQPFVSPASAPITIGLAYGVIIWGFAPVSISTNTARDLGTRIVAAIFFGKSAFTKYAAISVLVNIPATLFATGIYELLLRDSLRNIGGGHAAHAEGEEGLTRHLTRTGAMDAPTKQRQMGRSTGVDVENGLYQKES